MIKILDAEDSIVVPNVHVNIDGNLMGQSNKAGKVFYHTLTCVNIKIAVDASQYYFSGGLENTKILDVTNTIPVQLTPRKVPIHLS